MAACFFVYKVSGSGCNKQTTLYIFYTSLHSSRVMIFLLAWHKNTSQ